MGSEMCIRDRCKLLKNRILMVCLSGEDSVLAPLLEMCPGGEIDSHLEGSEREFSKLP